MGDPTPVAQEDGNLRHSLSMEFETQRVPINAITLSDPDKLKIFTKFTQDIQKKLTVHHPNLSYFKAIWFEVPQSENLYQMTGLSSSPIEQAPDSGTSPTFTCVSKEKYQFTPLLQWLEDRKHHSFHELQITHILLKVAFDNDKLIENGLSSLVTCLPDVHIIKHQPGNLIAPPFFSKFEVIQCTFSLSFRNLRKHKIWCSKFSKY